jgi:hypothetical protein
VMKKLQRQLNLLLSSPPPVLYSHIDYKNLGAVAQLGRATRLSFETARRSRVRIPSAPLRHALLARTSEQELTSPEVPHQACTAIPRRRCFNPKPKMENSIVEIQTILYAMVIAATAALFLFRWDLIAAAIKYLCGDHDDDDRGGGRMILSPVYQDF